MDGATPKWGMSVRRAPYNIHAAMIRESIAHIREVLALLESGDAKGVAVAVWASDQRSHRIGVSGYMRKHPRDAYWLLGRLKHQVLVMNPD